MLVHPHEFRVIDLRLTSPLDVQKPRLESKPAWWKPLEGEQVIPPDGGSRCAANRSSLEVIVRSRVLGP